MITHILMPDCQYLAEDTVFGVKESLIADFRRVEDAGQAAALGFTGSFWSVEWDFTLAEGAAGMRR